MGAFIVVVFKPQVKILLQGFQGFEEFLPEGDAKIFVQGGAVEALNKSFVFGVLTFVRLCSISFKARYSSYG